MLCGADAVVDGVQPGEARQIGIDDGRRQAWHRACTADDQHVARLGLGVEAADRRDEIARVGEIEIMAALRDAGPCDPMILRLEWAARVNDDIGSDPRERLRQVAVDVDRMGFGRLDGPDRIDESLRPGNAASADQQPDFSIAGEAARDIAAEITIAADDEDARYHVGLATMSQNTTTNPPNAGQPSMNHQRNRRLQAASSKAPPRACASSIAFMRIWIATTGSQQAPASTYKA